MRADGWLSRLFRRRAKQQFERALTEMRRENDFHLRMRQEGYHLVVDHLPPWHQPIEAVRLEWGRPHFIVLDEQPPEFNIAGLYWRQP